MIDYTREDWAARDTRYDLVFDAVGKADRSAALKTLAPGGSFETITRGGASKQERREQLQELCAMLAAGEIAPVVDRVYSLDEIAEAHRYAESGHKRGNLVIRIV